ncbi:hypothetical protein TWF506_010505 [Arthrobotrys conoides]|uniref:CBM1 domain-containing protein n=1 Tax=Arthrobotrys conoides TaxID=74498 RepID=A0AAN8RKZ7_9PEZI
MKFTIALAIAALASTAAATCSPKPVYAQCGGAVYTGCKQCVSTATCTFINDYYSQCYPKPQ